MRFSIPRGDEFSLLRLLKCYFLGPVADTWGEGGFRLSTYSLPIAFTDSEAYSNIVSACSHGCSYSSIIQRLFEIMGRGTAGSIPARGPIYRRYYTAARRYDFYLRVVKTIFYERAQRVSKILFLKREDKSHIFKPPCNALFII
jgi:hypothetical protein